MNELIEYIACNDFVTMALIVLLAVLIILFFVVLFSGKKKVVNKAITDDNIDANLKSDDTDQSIDFNHSEYVKETTAEFELAPVSEVMPNTTEEIPEVKEESQAIKIESSGNEPVLKDFSFDELSKSISEELDKLKIEEEQGLINKDEEEPFKNFHEVKISKFDEIKNDDNDSEPTFITESASLKEEKSPELPKLAKEESNEPVIKEEEVPLFARFNNETYDLNKKD